MIAGMITLALTFAVPFVGFLLANTQFMTRLLERSIEHADERLAQHKEDLGLAVVTQLPTTGKTSRLAA